MNLKNTLVILGIFSAGVGTGYLICKRVLRDQYQEDLDEVKQFYLNKIEEMGMMDEDFEPEEYEEDEYFRNVKGYSTAVTEDTGNWGKGRPIINYNKPPLEEYAEMLENEDIEEEDFDYEAELEARAEAFAERRFENRSNGRPYVIDYDEYMDGPEEYDRQVLYYYTKDRVLCEDDDSKIEMDDEEETIGFDYEDILDMQTTAWVRNDTIMVLYEIHRVEDSYAETVENAVETPREREYRLLGRRKQALDD